MEKLYGEELALRGTADAPGAGGLEVRVARFHNVYGPRGTWVGGREKAPAALLRKALLVHMALEDAGAQSGLDTSLQVWGDGKQVRTPHRGQPCTAAGRHTGSLRGRHNTHALT